MIFTLYDLNTIIIAYIIIIDHHNLNVLEFIFFLMYLHLEYHLNKSTWIYILPNVLASGIVLEWMHLTLTKQQDSVWHTKGYFLPQVETMTDIQEDKEMLSV